MPREPIIKSIPDLVVWLKRLMEDTLKQANRKEEDEGMDAAKWSYAQFEAYEMVMCHLNPDWDTIKDL